MRWFGSIFSERCSLSREGFYNGTLLEGGSLFEHEYHQEEAVFVLE